MSESTRTRLNALLSSAALLVAAVGCGAAPDAVSQPAPGEGLEAAGKALQLAPAYRLPPGCAAGERARWNVATGMWSCAAGTQAGQGLAAAEGVIFVDPAAHVPTDCGDGALASWDGAAWTCDVPTSDGDLLAELRCAPGEVPKREAGRWICAPDADVRAEGGTGLAIEGTQALLLSPWRLPQGCVAGQLPQWLGTRWGCADDRDADTDTDTLASLACTPGDTAAWDGAAWRCETDADSDPVAGHGLIATGRTLSLAPSFTAPGPCAAGQVPRWSGAGWDCADDLDTDIDADSDLLATLSCTSGAVPRWNGAAWACGAAALQAGEGLQLVDGALGVQADRALPQLCTPGQIATWNDGSWSCGENGTMVGVSGEAGLRGLGTAGAPTVELDLALTDGTYQPAYRRTVVVSPEGTPLDNGLALLAAVSGMAAAAPSEAAPWLITLEPGVYDIDTSTLVVPAWAVVEGAGIKQTVIRGRGTTVVALAGPSGLPPARNDVRRLRLEHPVSPAASPWVETVRIAERQVRISDVEIETAGIGITTTGIALHSGSLVLDRTFIQCSGGPKIGTVICLDAMAPLEMRGGSLTAWNGLIAYAARLSRAATIEGTALAIISSPQQSVGLVVNGLAGETIQIRNVSVQAPEALHVHADATARVSVEHSKLRGDSAAVVASGGTVVLRWTQARTPIQATGSGQVTCYHTAASYLTQLDVDCSWL